MPAGSLGDRWILGPDGNGVDVKLRATSARQRAQLKRDTLRFSFWNCCHLSVMLLDYLVGSQDGLVPGLGYDLYALVELHGDEQWVSELWGSGRMIVGGERPDDGSDKAGGVCMILSSRMLRASTGRVWRKGCRVLAVEFEADPVNVIAVVAYIPHHGRRQKPFAEDTWKELDELWGELPSL